MRTSRIGSSTRSWCGRSLSRYANTGWVSDTPTEAEAVRLAALRARSPEARLRDALELSEVVHAAVMARLRACYPDKTVVELALMQGADEAGTHKRRA